ncbi:hypothetical protein JOF53_008518 [Crossiella equi]|uniref:Rhamnogalacturonan I lyase beta-sheet domain-containing protein n=1 Tax=Crossiella equi TaxID=130796 RepID=A0ABS5AT70_9PSEU|nr:rhamnogalacturonan lyase [Crossiella equi]MBP2479646.1 hypothetical protein [Crossiella equi]
MHRSTVLRALLITTSSALVATAAVHPATAAAPAAAQAERLDRGLISVHTGTGNFLSWRLAAGEAPATAFAVYRDGRKVTTEPLTRTNFQDTGAPAEAVYEVRPVVGGVESAGPATPPLRMGAHTEGELGTTAATRDVPLQIPPGGSTSSGAYTYEANDASVGDLDGDGQYEIVLKWNPTNAKDNAQAGHTGNTILDAYELDGRRLWRIDLGRNIRSGAHYTQFQVFDYDGDGKAELAVKTADGTRSGTGQVIGNAGADHRNSSGYVLTGPEFLTVFRGTDGAVLDTENYVPPRGNVADWGDNYGNRADRFLAGTAFVDGARPSIVMARGYYTRAVVSAWDFRGGQLTRRWTYDSGRSGGAHGQGNHNLSVSDVDGDGRDEIIYGSATIDDNGALMYRTGFGHGDALHVSDLVPIRPGQEVFTVHESGNQPAMDVHDARTGQVIYRAPACGCDNGRGVAADVWAGSPGAEIWSSAVGGLRSAAGGNQVAARKPGSQNFVIWWDGDAQRELLDGTQISKYGTGGDTRLLTGSGVSSNNGTKSTPVLQADILGDWREEVIWRTSDNRALRIHATTAPTTISRASLMQDRQYRLAVAWQNTAYNQPPHASFSTP